MARIVFMGTPDFAVPSLLKLTEIQKVIGVVSQPDRPAGRGRQLKPPPVKAAALEAGIPVYQPESLRSEAAAKPLLDWAPDLIVVAAFGQILRPHVLALPSHGCLNVHASLLPRWRGAAPIQHAILAGDDETGISLMRMDEGLDTGPVYARRAVPIRPDETATSLHDRLAELGAVLLTEQLERILNGQLVAEPQDESRSTYAPMIKKQDGEINWNRSAAAIDRQVRALTPWPGVYTYWGGKRLKIVEADLVSDLPEEPGRPGQVVVRASGTVVLTGAGAIRLQQIQLEGKRVTTVEEFQHGQPDFATSHLPS